jgi:hypothetical protein
VITLGPDQAATVAAWAIKTAWMREETEPARLWPSASDITFPPVTTVSDQDVLMAVVQQPGLKFPPGTRFVRDPAGPQQRWRN